VTPEQREAVSGLLTLASGKLDLAWSYAPATVGGKMFGVALGNVDYARAYVHAAGDWLAAANVVLGDLDSGDADPLIDRLGAKVDEVQKRRTQLFNLGLSLEDPLVDATKEYCEQVRAELSRLLALLKKHLPSPGAIGVGVLLVVALVVLVIALR
jgi:hypothetical protein